MWYIAGSVVALAVGVYIGLGAPGLPGRQNRVLPAGRARRPKRNFVPLDWLKQVRR